MFLALFILMDLEIQTQRVMERKLVDKMSRERGLLQRFTIAAVALMVAASAFGDVLWWMVDDNATVDGSSVYSFVSSFGTRSEVDPDSGEEVSGYNVGARVKVTFADGRSETLPIIHPGSPGETFDHTKFFDGGGSPGGWFGTGSWNTMSSFSSEISSEVLFQIQLGELTWNDALDAFDFATLAETDPVAKSKLASHIFAELGWNGPANSQWAPTTFYSTTPEPSSGLLLLLGAAVLALKRKST